MGKIPAYHGISLVWYVPQHSGPYCGILVFLFLVTENLKLKKKFGRLEVETACLQVNSQGYYRFRLFWKYAEIRNFG